tara:strand:+ start:283 stop:456 length:174 start_codon:yes stop_codon:yes gene_type:complete
LRIESRICEDLEERESRPESFFDLYSSIFLRMASRICEDLEEDEPRLELLLFDQDFP